ncbi:uncharacterized protein LOC135150793 [Daucus carota subsp. sativus]|uniref:uncharacterized protein LOC135150793 n=1 Tax=Daucus carota subsp. sativus TaxID=79200 RepID=UPI0030826CBD
MQRNQQNSSPSAQFLANIDLSGISAGSSNIKKSCVTRGADSGKIRFQLPSSTVLPTPPIGPGIQSSGMTGSSIDATLTSEVAVMAGIYPLDNVRVLSLVPL